MSEDDKWHETHHPWQADLRRQLQETREKLEAAEKDRDRWHANYSNAEEECTSERERAEQAEKERDQARAESKADTRAERDSLREQLATAEAKLTDLYGRENESIERIDRCEKLERELENLRASHDLPRLQDVAALTESQAQVAALRDSLTRLSDAANGMMSHLPEGEYAGLGDVRFAVRESLPLIFATDEAAKAHDARVRREALEEAAKLVETAVLDERCEARPQVADRIRALARNGEQT